MWGGVHDGSSRRPLLGPRGVNVCGDSVTATSSGMISLHRTRNTWLRLIYKMQSFDFGQSCLHPRCSFPIQATLHALSRINLHNRVFQNSMKEQLLVYIRHLYFGTSRLERGRYPRDRVWNLDCQNKPVWDHVAVLTPKASWS